jgi:hypothetical protein
MSFAATRKSLLKPNFMIANFATMTSGQTQPDVAYPFIALLAEMRFLKHRNCHKKGLISRQFGVHFRFREENAFSSIAFLSNGLPVSRPDHDTPRQCGGAERTAHRLCRRF